MSRGCLSFPWIRCSTFLHAPVVLFTTPLQEVFRHLFPDLPLYPPVVKNIGSSRNFIFSHKCKKLASFYRNNNDEKGEDKWGRKKKSVKFRGVPLTLWSSLRSKGIAVVLGLQGPSWQRCWVSQPILATV